MTERLVVVGAGVAGVAAAVAAREAGHEVVVVSRGSGATAMTSGALDWTPWAEPAPPPPLTASEGRALADFVGELSFGIGPRWLITGAGVIRPAAGSDRLLLDLGGLSESATVGVVHTNWQLDPGARLLHALRSDPRAAGRTFVAVIGDRLFSEAERKLPLAALLDAFSSELAARFAELAEVARSSGVEALLVGPYLGVDPAAHEVLLRAPIPIKETTSPPDGSVGRRLEARLLDVLGRRDIRLVDARVERLLAVDDHIELTLHMSAPGTGTSERNGSAGKSLLARRVVLATGGLIGGGLSLGIGPGAGIDSPLATTARDTGSALGWDGASDGGSWLRPGLGPGLPEMLIEGRVLAVGDVRALARQTLLSAAHQGLSLF